MLNIMCCAMDFYRRLKVSHTSKLSPFRRVSAYCVNRSIWPVSNFMTVRSDAEHNVLRHGFLSAPEGVAYIEALSIPSGVGVLCEPLNLASQQFHVSQI